MICINLLCNKTSAYIQDLQLHYFVIYILLVQKFFRSVFQYYSDLFMFLTEKLRQPCPPTAWPVAHRRGTPAALEYALYSQYRAVNRWEQKCVLSRVVRKCVQVMPPNKFSLNERVYIYKTYLKSRKSCAKTRRKFRNKFPNRPVPTANTIVCGSKWGSFSASTVSLVSPNLFQYQYTN